MGRKFALLVGIDNYIDGPRSNTKGIPIRLNNLHGCVNDVSVVAEILQRFGFQDLIRLTSPTPLASITDLSPNPETDGLPTSSSIRATLYDLLKRAGAGDFFFFHFSGHGALLKRIEQSPSDGSTKDASLLPMDYCANEPAIRGWQLNNVLRRFHKKSVHVVVSLDSCFSGGSWRDGTVPRSPADWMPPPNLPIDEDVDTFLTALHESRHGNLEKSWDINPEGFVLMAACSKDQVALEVTRDEKKHGVFTYELCRYLTSQHIDGRPTYRSICDHIQKSIPSSQTPQVFGQDRLAFLESREVFATASVRAEVKDRLAMLPIGKVQGVVKGALFISRHTTSDILLTVDEVDDFTSKGTLSATFAGAALEFVPFQWCSGKTVEVHVDVTLGPEFRRTLQSRLKERVASGVAVTENAKVASDEESDAVHFHLQKTSDDGIAIFAPAFLGHQGPAHYLRSQGQGSHREAARAADALAHLFRFSHVYSLRKEFSEDTATFKVTLDSTSTPEAPFSDGHIVRYTFQNEGQDDLYFTLLNLGPGFHIRQMFPAHDAPQHMPRGSKRSFRLKLTVPCELREGSVRHEGPHRDTLRTVVTRSVPLSLKSMELPDIWDAELMRNGVQEAAGRDVGIFSDSASDFAWWVEDTEVYTGN